MTRRIVPARGVTADMYAPQVSGARPPAQRPGWDDETLGRSRISDAIEVENAGIVARRTVQLIAWDARRPHDARLVRLTLRPLERVDGAMFSVAGTGQGPVVDGSPAGWTRTNVAAPVADRPVNGVPAYVRIEWATAAGRKSLLVADYPAAGGSVDIVASSLRADVLWAGAPRVTPADRGPVFAAELGPAEGPGGQLTFAQTVSVGGGGALFSVAAVPAFARRVVLAVIDHRTYEAGGIVTVLWMDSSGTVTYATWRMRSPSPGVDALGANIPPGTQPVELDIPQGAQMMIVSTSGSGTPVSLVWRLVP